FISGLLIGEIANHLFITFLGNDPNQRLVTTDRETPWLGRLQARHYQAPFRCSSTHVAAASLDSQPGISTAASEPAMRWASSRSLGSGEGVAGSTGVSIATASSPRFNSRGC